jgi:hypothetical protein
MHISWCRHPYVKTCDATAIPTVWTWGNTCPIDQLFQNSGVLHVLHSMVSGVLHFSESRTIPQPNLPSGTTAEDKNTYLLTLHARHRHNRSLHRSPANLRLLVESRTQMGAVIAANKAKRSTACAADVHKQSRADTCADTDIGRPTWRQMP